MKPIAMAGTAERGFTLIELMIVVAIIGILAAVAIPAYQNYMVKAKVGSALNSVSSIKTAIALCIQEQGGVFENCTTNAAATHITTFVATKEVASVVVSNGILILKFANNISLGVDNETITMTPVLGNGAANLTWGNVTSVSNVPAKDLITKNNPPG